MNFFVDVFGGKEGWMGSCYAPTPAELLKTEQRRTKRQGTALARQMQETETARETKRKAVLRFANDGRDDLAKERARDVVSLTAKYNRLRAQKNCVTQLADKMEAQMTAVSVDRSMAVLVSTMAGRLALDRPDQFARMMMKYEKLTTRESMAQEQLQSFFTLHEEEEEEQAKDDEAETDQKVAKVFIELGLKRFVTETIDDAPPIPVKNPGNPPPPGGTGSASAIEVDENT